MENSGYVVVIGSGGSATATGRNNHWLTVAGLIPDDSFEDYGWAGITRSEAVRVRQDASVASFSRRRRRWRLRLLQRTPLIIKTDAGSMRCFFRPTLVTYSFVWPPYWSRSCANVAGQRHAIRIFCTSFDWNQMVCHQFCWAIVCPKDRNNYWNQN